MRQLHRPETPTVVTRTWASACRALAAFFLLSLGALDPVSAAEVAILKSADLPAYNQAVAGFKAAMPSATTFSEYDMKGDPARGQNLARRIRESDAALLLAVGIKAAQVAKREVPDIPVVFCMVLDLAKQDLKAPNITGIRLEIPVTRQFTAMRSVLPSARRIGVLYDPDKTGGLVEEARLQARGLGIEVLARPVRSEKDVATTLRGLLPEIDALWLIPDSTVLTEESLRFVMGATLDANVPLIAFSSELVRSGALLGLSVHYDDVGRQAGLLAKKILLDQYSPNSTTFPPDRFRLALNLKTAKFLGITIAPEVMSSADELY